MFGQASLPVVTDIIAGLAAADDRPRFDLVTDAIGGKMMARSWAQMLIGLPLGWQLSALVPGVRVVRVAQAPVSGRAYQRCLYVPDAGR